MIRRFFEQAWLNFKGQKAAFQLEEFILFDAGYPILTLIFYCILASYSFKTRDLASWVIGNSFLLCVNTSIFTLGGAFTGERYYGRIRFIIASPTNKLSLILQKGVFPCIIAVATVFIGFIVGSLIFGIDFSRINLLYFLIITLVAMFSVTGFGLLLAVFGLVTDSMHMVLNLSNYVLMILCGANFPVSQLPSYARIISRLLPLTRSIEATNGLYAGLEFSKIGSLIIGELCIGIVYYIIGALIVHWVEKIAIKKATLEVF